MSDIEFYTDGFDELSKLIEKMADRAKGKKVLEALETGAGQLEKDVRALPKPRSEIRTAGYTHLLDTVTHRTVNDEVEVGWGKYYGPMVERGARTMKKAHPHISTTFERNKKSYYQVMIEKLGF